MKLSAILPLPAAVAQHPASVFTLVEGEPVSTRIVRALSAVVDEVLVPADDALIERLHECLAGLPARIIGVGESPSTAECLAAAAAQLPAAATHALVADHRHPVISAELLARVTAALAGGAPLVVPVLPVTDTVKTVDGQGTIASTVDRSALRVIQYPYGAAVSRLGDLMDVLAAGPDLVTVAGDADAIPFDLPADSALLAAVIACRR